MEADKVVEVAAVVDQVEAAMATVEVEGVIRRVTVVVPRKNVAADRKVVPKDVEAPRRGMRDTSGASARAAPALRRQRLVQVVIVRAST